MKIFIGEQIKQHDVYTIEHEPIRSVDLMERAAACITRTLIPYLTPDTPIYVFAGPGNNGGDALAVSRMLAEEGYPVHTYLFNIQGGQLSDDCECNKIRLIKQDKVKHFEEVINDFNPPKLQMGMIVIDGLFGSGLSRPLEGGFAALVRYINSSSATVFSIDLPSGLMTEDNGNNNHAHIIKADHTLTLQQKKLSMFMADTQPYLGSIKVLDIRLSEEYTLKTTSRYETLEEKDIRQMLLPRNQFAHKGDMGHALLMSGSYGMAGAAIMSLRACLRSGVGNVTAALPTRLIDIMQTAVPEAIVRPDVDEEFITIIPEAKPYDAVCIGPGIGQNEATALAVFAQIRNAAKPLLIDADAINILANHKTWLQALPQETILTPHPGEFDRLCESPVEDCFERLSKAQEMAQEHHVYILLKGHYSMLCTPQGKTYINTTGNAGMATAGSGDVLSGIITALLARGYAPGQAAILGMYIHGLAGDLAAEVLGQESLIASDIIDYLPMAFKRIR